VAAARSDRPVFDTLRSDAGADGLRATRRVDFGRKPRWLVTATVARDRADEALARFARTSATAVLAASLLIAAGSLVVLSRALKPVQDLVADAVILARERARSATGCVLAGGADPRVAAFGVAAVQSTPNQPSAPLCSDGNRPETRKSRT
jgi:hypothetical protein